MNTSANTALEACRALIAREAQDVANTAESLNDTFMEIAHKILELEGKVVCSGSGTSGTVARRMAHLFNVTGTPALYQNPADGLHGSLGVVTEKDLVIAISKGGESDELSEFVRRAKHRGAFIVVLTCYSESSLERLSDITCVTPFMSGDPENVLAMGSTLSNCAWGDAMAMYIRTSRGFTWDEVLYLHPSGKVGKETQKTLKRISDSH
ncbi:KpsF/GutQ family sugar-phosphate isomerase [Schaalia sp. lx-260]|uniref:KpsF/GutQ family sugar-phosphate isomerase n=1 Tax=Schaalia sp. lx-260 TaxID=2899082 RepID=UPI001E31C093|nr:SIS domain-containing protein [Schaalia sp. lx-260]MCD4548937.1 SIS domain-containing protein [Schaalia sp. lx-260]